MDTSNRVASMQIRRICRVVAAAAFVVLLASKACTAAAAEHPVHHATGIADQSITLACVAHHSGGQLRDVTWSDRVFINDESEQSIIFRSENNAARHVSTSHSNSINYKVDADFRLTISNLNRDTDVGEYICTSTGSNGVQHERHYFLSVMNKPECTATLKTVKPNKKTKLSCEMQFGAMTQPAMNWYRGDEMISSTDNFEPGLAKRDVEITATVDDDRRPFVCVTQLGNVTNKCNVTLSVPHAVRVPQFVAVKRSYEAGEELRCAAKGNPLPRITLSPSVSSKEAGAPAADERTPALQESSGDGWRSIRIPKEWVRKTVTVTCSGTNTVDGNEKTESSDITFDVTEPAKITGGRGASAHWNASPISTFLTSLWSLLLAGWPVFIARVVC